jgi:hypothetical protein
MFKLLSTIGLSSGPTTRDRFKWSKKESHGPRQGEITSVFITYSNFCQMRTCEVLQGSGRNLCSVF